MHSHWSWLPFLLHLAVNSTALFMFSVGWEARSFLTVFVSTGSHLALLSSSSLAQCTHPTTCHNTTGALTSPQSHQRGRLSPQLFVFLGNKYPDKASMQQARWRRKEITYVFILMEPDIPTHFGVVILETAQAWSRANRYEKELDCYFQQTKHIPFLCCWPPFSETADVMQTLSPEVRSAQQQHQAL